MGAGRSVMAGLAALSVALGACSDEPDPTCRDRGDCELGEGCELHSHCASGYCLAVDAEAAEGELQCAQGCGDEDECPAGLSCRLVAVEREGPEEAEDDVPVEGVEAACLPTFAGAGLVGDTCGADAACRAGLCDAGRCTELCGACGPGAVCEQSGLSRYGYDLERGVCRWSLAAPAIELRPVEVDADGSGPIALEIPGGLASFTVIVHYATDDYHLRAGVRSLVAPDGTVLTDSEDEIDDINPPANRYPGASSLLVPATDAPVARPQAGTYQLEVGLWETDYVSWTAIGGTLDGVTVVFERAGEEGGHLDLAVFFAPGTGLGAADAAESEYVQALLQTVADTYREQAAVELGVVRYDDVPAEYDAVDSSDTIRDVCARFTEPGPHRVAVNVVVVGDIPFTDGYTAGTPSPPGVFGTAASCIVIDKAGDPFETGLVVAHELGHFLGLKHTTFLQPADGGGYDIVGEDAISDTPTCASGTALHACPDYRNLMFPFFPAEEGLALTAAQGRVIRANPLLYEIDRPRLCEVTTPTWDLTDTRRAASGTAGSGDHLAGSCGGAGAADRLHVYRLRGADLGALEVTVRGDGFAPAVYVREDGCDAEAPELGCASGAAGEDVTVRIEAPRPANYFIVVDGAEEGTSGRFVLDVVEFAAP